MAEQGRAQHEQHTRQWTCLAHAGLEIVEREMHEFRQDEAAVRRPAAGANNGLHQVDVAQYLDRPGVALELARLARLDPDDAVSGRRWCCGGERRRVRSPNPIFLASHSCPAAQGRRRRRRSRVCRLGLRAGWLAKGGARARCRGGGCLSLLAPRGDQLFDAAGCFLPFRGLSPAVLARSVRPLLLPLLRRHFGRTVALRDMLHHTPAHNHTHTRTPTSTPVPTLAHICRHTHTPTRARGGSFHGDGPSDWICFFFLVLTMLVTGPAVGSLRLSALCGTAPWFPHAGTETGMANPGLGIGAARRGSDWGAGSSSGGSSSGGGSGGSVGVGVSMQLQSTLAARATSLDDSSACSLGLLLEAHTAASVQTASFCGGGASEADWKPAGGNGGNGVRLSAPRPPYERVPAFVPCRCALPLCPVLPALRLLPRPMFVARAWAWAWGALHVELLLRSLCAWMHGSGVEHGRASRRLLEPPYTREV